MKIEIILLASGFALLIFFWAMHTLLGETKKYYSQQFINKNSSSFLSNSIQSIQKQIEKKVNVKGNKREDLLALFERVGWKKTPEELMSQQILYGFVGLLIFVAVTIFTQYLYCLIIGILFSFFMYQFPMIALKSTVKEKEEQLRRELPDYIDLLILLFSSGLTPYDAIKMSAEQASNGLRYEVGRLSADMDVLTPEIALDRFGNLLGITEAKRFIRALKQSIQMEQSQAQDILKTQSEFMRELRAQNLRKIAKERPLKVQLISTGVFVFIVLIPLSTVGVTFTSMYSGL